MAAAYTLPAFTTSVSVPSGVDINQAADFWIKVKDETIAVHKDLLIATVPYFQCLFEAGMQEVQNQTITIDYFRPTVVKTMIKYIYGESTNFEWKDIADYIDLVESWHMVELKNDLDKHISRRIDHDNCIYWLVMAQTYSLNNVKISTTEHLLENFTKVITGWDFLQLELGQLQKLLSDEVQLNTSCEAKLGACINWVRGDETARQCHYTALLEHIDLKFCSEQFMELVKQVYSNKKNVDREVYKRYIDPLLGLTEHDPTKNEQSVMVIGRETSCHKSSVPTKLSRLKINLQDISVQEFPAIPRDFAKPFHCLTPCGIFADIFRRTGLRQFCRGNVLLDGSTMCYVNMPPLPFASLGLKQTTALVYSGNSIFCCGFDSQSMFWMLDLGTLQWTRCAPAPLKEDEVPMLCAVGNQIYFMSSESGVFFKYDTERDRWTKVHFIPVVISDTSCAVAVDTDMFILNCTVIRDEQTEACAKYDTISGQWTIVKSLPVSCASYAASSTNGKIVVVGRVHSTKSVCLLLYDPESDEWEAYKIPWDFLPICIEPL